MEDAGKEKSEDIGGESGSPGEPVRKKESENIIN